MKDLTEAEQVEYDELHKNLVAQGGPTVGHLKAAGEKDPEGVARLVELGWVDPDASEAEKTCGMCTDIGVGVCEHRLPSETACGELHPNPVDPPKPAAKGVQQLQDEGDKARRAGVDALNKEIAANQKKAAGELADTPLNDEEQAFVARIALRMNCGRAIEAPSAAEILRYSKLVGRVDVVAEEGE